MNKINKTIALSFFIATPFIINAQVLSSGPVVSQFSTENVFLDVSTNFDPEISFSNNIGKGLLFPRTDLTQWSFNIGSLDGLTFPTAFDGMIVYNTGTGSTPTTGNNASTSTNVTPGFYYFSNPSGSTSVTGGVWKPLGSGTAGNYTAGNGISLNSNNLMLGGDLMGPTAISKITDVNTLSFTSDNPEHATITVGTPGQSSGGVYFGNGMHGVKRGFPTTGIDNNVGLYTTAGNLYLSSKGANTGEFILTDGKVGVGTDTPSAILHVSQKASTDPIDAMTVDVASFSTGSNADASHFFRVRDLGGGTVPFIIKGNGNVGIGTSVPETKLDVPAGEAKFGSTAGSNVRLGAGYVDFYNSDGAKKNNIITYADNLYINSTSSAAHTVLNNISGNVGIGTNSPKATLDVAAKTTDGSLPEGLIAPRLTGDQIKAGDAQYSTNQTGTILYATSAVTASSTKTANITAAGYYYFDGSVWQKVGSYTASNGVSLNGSNLTLGGSLTGSTTISGLSDTNTLSFKSSNDADAAITVGTTGGGSGAIYFGNANHGIKRGFATAGVGNDLGLYTTSGNVYLSSNGANSGEFVLSGGKVGIGTTTPHSELHLGNTLSNRKITLYEEGNNDNQFYGIGVNPSIMRYQIGNTAARHTFFAGNDAASSKELMTITGDGKIGIGTGLPGATLQVDGNVIMNITGASNIANINDTWPFSFRSPFDGQAAVTIGTNSNEYGALYLGYSAFGLKRGFPTVAAADKANVGLYSTGGKLFLSTKGESTGEFVLSGGKVGIGTTAPNATLDVSAATTNGSQPEGFIAPRLTGDQIKAGDAQYGANQAGAILYATAAVTASSTKTANITAAGYYYFDGNVWQKVGSGTAANYTASNGVSLSGSNLTLGGDLTGATAISGIDGTKTLAFRGSDASTAAITVGTDGGGSGGVYFGNAAHGVKRGFPATGSDNNVGLYTTSGNVFLSSNGANTGEFVLSGGKVGLGTVSPATKLEINNGSSAGAIKIVDGTQGDGKVLVSDANGVGTWQSLSNGSWTAVWYDFSSDSAGNIAGGSTLLYGTGGSVSANNASCVTVPKSGLYKISGSFLGKYVSAPGTLNFQLRVNNTIVTWISDNDITAADGQMFISTGQFRHLNAGDVLSIIRQGGSSGSAVENGSLEVSLMKQD
jgi:hypothetical protein